MMHTVGNVCRHVVLKPLYAIDFSTKSSYYFYELLYKNLKIKPTKHLLSLKLWIFNKTTVPFNINPKKARKSIRQ